MSFRKQPPTQPRPCPPYTNAQSKNNGVHPHILNGRLQIPFGTGYYHDAQGRLWFSPPPQLVTRPMGHMGNYLTAPQNYGPPMHPQPQFPYWAPSPRNAQSYVADDFVIDRLCHPTGVYCSIRDIAEDLLIEKRGGFYNNMQCICPDGNRKRKANGGHEWRFYCGACDPKTLQWSYNFRAKVRYLNNSRQCAVLVHRFNNIHCHEVKAKPAEPSDQYGLHPTLLRIATQFVESSNKSVLQVKSSQLLHHLSHQVQSRKDDLEGLRYVFDDDKYFLHTKKQVRFFIEH